MTPLQRVRAALGKRFGELLAEVPRRRKWVDLPDEKLEQAFHDAQRQARGGQMERPFATLLIAHLDYLVGISPERPVDVEADVGDTVDSFGRLHRPDHDFAARERRRLELERMAEEAYARTYEEELDAGLSDAEAHRRASEARAEVLRSDSA
jgi:hypothetical protein